MLHIICLLYPRYEFERGWGYSWMSLSVCLFLSVHLQMCKGKNCAIVWWIVMKHCIYTYMHFDSRKCRVLNLSSRSSSKLCFFPCWACSGDLNYLMSCCVSCTYAHFSLVYWFIKFSMISLWSGNRTAKGLKKQADIFFKWKRAV